MSAFTKYAAHAEHVAARLAHDEVEMLVYLHDDEPDLYAFPVSGDMLAVKRRATHYVARQRARLASMDRRAS